ncbi:MAG: ATP-dependent metallopeptidase FtsH/Yme1/Tma family protein, partial [Gammaproteobacteria bacterium]
MNDLAKNLLLWIVIAIVLVSVFNNFSPPRAPASNISYSEFISKVKGGEVAEVLIEGRSIHGRTVSNENFKTYSPGDPKLVDDLLSSNVQI